VFLPFSLLLIVWSTSARRTGLSISYATLGDVVSDGVVQPTWSAFSPRDLSARIDAQFQFALVSSLLPTQNFSIELTYNNTVLYSISNNASAGVILYGAPVSMYLLMVCAADQVSTIVQVDFVMPVETLSFYFRKTCLYPMVNVGTMDEAANLIHESQSMGLYRANDEPYTDLYVWLDPAYPQSVFPIPYTLSFTTEPEVGVNMEVHGKWLAQLPALGHLSDFTRLRYTCADNLPEPVEGHVHVRFVLGGWLYMSWLNVLIAKRCPATLPPPSSNGPTLTPAGVAAVVIVVLGVAACVASCLFNHFKRGMTGWDVLPGITYYRRCFASCCGSPRSSSHHITASGFSPLPEPDSRPPVGSSHGVGPQMDTYDDGYDSTGAAREAHAKAYSSTYQTDL